MLPHYFHLILILTQVGTVQPGIQLLPRVENIHPCRDSQHSNAFRDMPNITESMKATIDKCRTGTLGNNKRLHMMKILPHTRQYIARHDKEVRMMIKSLIKGQQGEITLLQM